MRLLVMVLVLIPLQAGLGSHFRLGYAAENVSRPQLAEKTDCASAFSWIVEESPGQLPALMTGNAPPRSRSMPNYDLAAAEAIGQERRILDNLVFKTHLLFDTKHQAGGDKTTDILRTVETKVGALELTEEYAKKFAKAFGVSRDQAAASIDTLLEMKTDPNAADAAIQRIAGKAIAGLDKERAALLPVTQCKGPHRELLPPFILAMGSPMWGSVVAHNLGMGTTAGLVAIPVCLATGVTWFYLATRPPLEARNAAKRVSEINQLIEAELKESLRKFPEREADRQFEMGWERWREAIKKSYEKTQDPSETDLRINAERLYATSVMLEKFQRLELPNGGKVADLLRKSGRLTPEALSEIQASIQRKRTQLTMIGEEFKRIAEDSQLNNEEAQEALRQIQLAKESDADGISQKILKRRLEELPVEVQLSLTQKITAETSQKMVRQALSRLDVLSKVIEELGAMPEENGWLKRWMKQNKLKKKFDEFRDGFKTLDSGRS